MLEKIFEKPLRLVSIVGVVYIIINFALNLFTGFSYSGSIFPCADIVTYAAEGAALVLCLLTFFISGKNFLYYISIEVLVFSNLYDGKIYAALFLSSLLLVLLLTVNKVLPKKYILIYSIIELAKLGLVIPYGAGEFFNYVGLTLFSLCTIGCINLLFHHAYTRRDSDKLNLDDYKLSDRQKECIKEIVVNNTTIKALAITYNVSESAIKKDLAHIYKILGITGKADLKALFIDYKF